LAGKMFTFIVSSDCKKMLGRKNVHVHAV